MVVDTKTDKQKIQYQAWNQYLLDQAQPKRSVQKFVENCETKPNSEETAHIVHCIDAAMQELCGICPCEIFMKAVLKNDLRGAIGHADDINSKWLKIYVSWFYNEVPGKLLDYYRTS